MESDNTEEIKAKTEELKQASYKIAEEVYKQQAANGQAGPDMGGAGATDSANASTGPEKGTADDVDYEVVDDDK